MFGDDTSNVKVILFMTLTTSMQIIHVQKKLNKKANKKGGGYIIGWFAIANVNINFINVIYVQFQYPIFV